MDCKLYQLGFDDALSPNFYTKYYVEPKKILDFNYKDYEKDEEEQDYRPF